MESLREYQGNLLLVRNNYDKETKEHRCVIEKYRKQLKGQDEKRRKQDGIYDT